MYFFIHELYYDTIDNGNVDESDVKVGKWVYVFWYISVKNKNKKKKYHDNEIVG